MAGIQGASGAFNVGNSCTIVVQHPLAPGGQLTVPNITGFKCAQQTTDINSMRLDGINLSAKLPKGWTGNFMADRGSSDVDDLFALIEAAWYNSKSMIAATLFQYITELNGSISTYQHTSVSLKYADAGDWKGDAIVKQTVDFEAFRRIRV